MPVLGTDNYLNAVGDTEKYNILSNEEIEESIFRAYAKLIVEREKKGDYYTGFTREDYEKYKRPSDPSRWKIENSVGNWDRVTSIIPMKIQKRRRNKWEEVSPGKFHQILSSISKESGKHISEITISDFNDFKMNHPEYDIKGWRCYTRSVIGEDKWKKSIDFITRIFPED